MTAGAETNYQQLLGLPTEMLLDVYSFLDIESILALSATTKVLRNFFHLRKSSILLPVLIRDFSPFHELLQVYTANATDVDAQTTYEARRIIFRRLPSDDGLLLSSPFSNLDSVNQMPMGGFTKVVKQRKRQGSHCSGAKTVILTERDLDGILQKCKVVRDWERLFPQMRWMSEPEYCRMLHSHERVRFRRALYRWWLYGVYFHGQLPRPRVGSPEPYIQDVRISQLRHHSTSELLELMDLVETTKDLVKYYICPRLDPDQATFISQIPDELVDRGHSLSNSWRDQSQWGRIIKTYAKLGPEDLLYYFENIYSFSRKRLITDVHLKHPNFLLDQESIQVAIRCALDERQWLTNAPHLAENNVGGIIDFDDERDDERLAYGNDASPDGALPSGATYVRSLSQYSPRGDDGSLVEETNRYHEQRFSLALSPAMGLVVE